MQPTKAPHENSTKQRILTAAINLFSLRGFSAVSVREIAREVGIKESSLYNHFPSKDAILNEILEWYRQAISNNGSPEAELAAKIVSLSPAEFLHMGYRRLMATMADPIMECITRIVLMEQFRNKQAREMVLSTIHQPLSMVEKVFTVMSQKGLILPYDPKVLAAEYEYPLNAMFLEYTLLRFDGADTQAIEQQMLNHITFFLERITAQPNKEADLA